MPEGQIDSIALGIAGNTQGWKNGDEKINS
jgi:hypothetical protein